MEDEFLYRPVDVPNLRRVEAHFNEVTRFRLLFKLI